MCGFLGYTRTSSTQDQESNSKTLLQMLTSIAHRGPDAENSFVDKTMTLGFRRLAFIDVHGHTQPLFNEDKSKTLVFNGEVYNYLDLRRELKEKGHTFYTEGDSETLLHGYEEYGEDLPNHLRGMFAFAIYDNKENTVFLARDNFGIKPLYYYQKDDLFLFSSELKSFLHHPEFVKEFDESLLPEFLTFSCVPGGEKTFFKNVKKLLPGHTLTYNITTKSISIKKYFTVDFKIDNSKTFEDVTSEISDTFSKSVSAHMISDEGVKVGAFLSGGVDSAYTVAEVKKHLDPVTYTIGFKETEYSEANDARYTADLLKVENNEVVVSAEEYLREAGKVQYHMDEPLGNPSANLLYFLSKRTSQDLKAVLSGEGADEMFGGYNVYQEPLALAGYQKLPLVLRLMIAKVFRSVSAYYPLPGNGFVQRGAKRLEDRYIGNSNIFTPEEQKLFLKENFQNPQYSPQLYTKPVFDELKKVMGDKYETLDDVSKMQFLDIHLWMVHEILQKADKMSMAHSLELRVPFLDKEIWKIGSTLPLKYKVNQDNGGTKLALRAAARKVLDLTSSRRKKRAFPLPLPLWLRSESYQNVILESFNSSVAEMYFNTSELKNLLSEHKEGKHNHSRKIWTVYTFLVWYREFFEVR